MALPAEKPCNLGMSLEPWGPSVLVYKQDGGASAASGPSGSMRLNSSPLCLRGRVDFCCPVSLLATKTCSCPSGVPHPPTVLQSSLAVPPLPPSQPPSRSLVMIPRWSLPRISGAHQFLLVIPSGLLPQHQQRQPCCCWSPSLLPWS